MDFIDKNIAQYVEQHSQTESPLLEKLDRETHTDVMFPRMLSGHLQGRVLSMLSHMIKPKHILEIGTYTGYSCICLAEGLAPKGTITTIDINEELEDMVRGYLKKAKIENKVEYILGNALDIIPTIDSAIDLVFLDADKENYSTYYSLLIDKLSPGGFIIADNVLWSGKVVDCGKKMDKDTKAILEFNKLVQEDVRVENVLFPIRDGLMIVRKCD